MPLLLPWRDKKPSETRPTFHEATEAEENEEFTFQVFCDVFAPQHNKRVPEGTAILSKRVPLTTADKKKVNKASISLPVSRTFKLFTYNCNPFILENCVPVEELRKKLISRQLTNLSRPGNAHLIEEPPPDSHSAPAVQQRTSLGGATLYSINDRRTFAARPELQPSDSVSSQNRQNSEIVACSVASHLRLRSNVRPELLVKIYSWLDHVEHHVETPIEVELGSANLVSGPAIDTPVAAEPESPNLIPDPVINTPAAAEPEAPNLIPDPVNDTPTAAEPEAPNLDSDLVLDEEVWDLIERDARRRKSRLRQIPNTMSTENHKTSIRGSSNSRPSGSYLRPDESNTRTSTDPIKNHPGTSARRPKSMPSGSQLPPCWNDEMDELICHMEAQCEFNTKSIVRALKQKFAELREHVIQEEAIQRRIETLDNQDNAYFMKGAEMAVVQAEANGYEMPPFDPANYPIINWEVKPDHIVLGTAPSKEVIDSDYEYSLQPRVVGGVDIETIKIGPDTPKKTLPIRSRQEAIRRVQNAGTFSNIKGLKCLTDITNDTNARSNREPKHDPSKDGGLADITNTMSNARIASNPYNDVTNGGILGSQVYSTPTKSSKKVGSAVSNDTIRAINNGSPTPTQGLYRSGRENAMSSSTTGTSILGFGREGFGRENSGGPTILERRRARQENRESSLIHGGSPRTP